MKLYVQLQSTIFTLPMAIELVGPGWINLLLQVLRSYQEWVIKLYTVDSGGCVTMESAGPGSTLICCGMSDFDVTVLSSATAGC